MSTAALPQSELGRCTGRFHLGSWPLIVMRCYFDGSFGDEENGSQWLTLAGYMANDAIWGDFQKAWDRMLRERYPIAPWLHMSEMLAHEDPFQIVNGWTDEKIERFVFDALNLLQNVDKYKFRSFVYSFDVAARKRLLLEGYDIAEPSEVCADSCIALAFHWYSDHHTLEPAYLFFDQNEQFIGPVKRRWKANVKPGQRLVLDPFWGLIANITDVDMRLTPPIQAADLLAWSCNRSLYPKERRWQHLYDVMRAVIPQSSGKMGEVEMRAKYKKRN